LNIWGITGSVFFIKIDRTALHITEWMNKSRCTHYVPFFKPPALLNTFRTLQTQTGLHLSLIRITYRLVFWLRTHCRDSGNHLLFIRFEWSHRIFHICNGLSPVSQPRFLRNRIAFYPLIPSIPDNNPGSIQRPWWLDGNDGTATASVLPAIT